MTEASYQPGYYIIYDGKSNTDEPETTFIYPNTTTLVDIIMNRIQTDKLLNVSDYAKVVK